MTTGAKPLLVLIEDNPADVLLVREAIRSRAIDAEVISYDDGPEAIAALLDPVNRLPDAILIDLNLPKSDGIQVIRGLLDSPRLKEVPLAILTSSRSPRDIDDAEKMKVSLYIHKPPTLDEFLGVVGMAIAELLSMESGDAAPAL